MKKTKPFTNIKNSDAVPDETSVVKSATILVVDDFDMNCELISAYLEVYSNLTVVLADNGKTGIEKAREWKPDLILLDIKMPIMNGYEAAEIIKNDPDLKSIPIIALTAATADEANKLITEHFDALLTKPFTQKQLIDMIDKFEINTVP